jgi:hypothetical protein
VIRRPRVLAVPCSSRSQGLARSLLRKRSERHRWPGITGLGVAIVLLATKSWMMVEPSNTGRDTCSDARAGWKRAACAESAERSESRSCCSRPMSVHAERRVLALATSGKAARAASQQQHGKTAAKILPRWKCFRSTF